MNQKGVIIRNPNPEQIFTKIQLKEFEYLIQKKDLEIYNPNQDQIPTNLAANFGPIYLTLEKQGIKIETDQKISRKEFYPKIIESVINQKDKEIDFDYVIDHISFLDLDKANPYAEYLSKELFDTEFFKKEFQNMIFNPNKFVLNQEAYSFLNTLDEKLSIF